MANKVCYSLFDYKYSNPVQHSVTPLRASGRYDYKNLVCSSRVVEFSNAAEILLSVALRKTQGTQSENVMCEHCCIRTLHLDTTDNIAPESCKRGTPNLELKLRRVCSIDRKPHPLCSHTYEVSFLKYWYSA